MNPGHAEVPGNGLDDNCNGRIDESCFIATAAYGTGMTGKIDVLRVLRDRYLVKNLAGLAFVEAYYRYSPPLASLVAEHGRLRSLAPILLLPLIGQASLCA